jgi:DNA-binding NarL/FixJ family response regulator
MPMQEPSPQGVVHLIEPQGLFVATLRDLFSEAGLCVTYSGKQLDPRCLLDDSPDIVFIDADYVDDPFGMLSLTRTLVPNAVLCVYAEYRGAGAERAYRAAGADEVFMKTADWVEIVAAIRRVRRRGHGVADSGA